MRITIRDVGTSKGIIIPAALLKEYHLAGEVELQPTAQGLLLSAAPQPRSGWEEDARQIAASGEKPLLPDFFEDEPTEGWDWGDAQ